MIERASEINCPKCGHTVEESMPETSCQVFYLCGHCGTTLHPKLGDCCVYCSYGSVPCPPVQQEGGRGDEVESTV